MTAKNQALYYQYDAAGNMTHDATASLSYSYDQENRLTGAAGYAYTYDGDGNRVRKSNGTLAANGTLYWYMTPGVVAESDLSGALKSEYVFFDGERVARKDFPGNAVSYYFSDHLKTASVITDSAGAIKAESDYYPWGGELQFVANDSNHYKFTSKERDTETNLDYFGARYYSNAMGRWISADWSAAPVPVPYADFNDPQSLNLYGFVGGNPASKADPDGHQDDQSSILQKIWNWLTTPMPPPQLPNCPCTETQKQDNKNQNNNNSKSTNQQGSGGQKLTKAEQAKANAEKGAASEKKVLNDKGLAKNTQKVSGSEGKSVPDGLTEKESVEIKDAARVTDSKQARVQQEAAKDSGRTNTLVTGEKTNVTPKASSRYDQIERRKDLGPQK